MRLVASDRRWASVIGAFAFSALSVSCASAQLQGSAAGRSRPEPIPLRWSELAPENGMPFSGDFEDLQLAADRLQSVQELFDA